MEIYEDVYVAVCSKTGALHMRFRDTLISRGSHWDVEWPAADAADANGG